MKIKASVLAALVSVALLNPAFANDKKSSSSKSANSTTTTAKSSSKKAPDTWAEKVLKALGLVKRPGCTTDDPDCGGGIVMN